MSKDAAWAKLKKLRIKPYDYGENDEDIITWIRPQRALIFTGFFDYYGRKRMFLYFGDDDALDRVTFEPGRPNESLYEIEIFEAEGQP